MSKPERQIHLKLSGPPIEDGRVSLSVLAGKIDSLQKAFYNIAAATNRNLSSRGTWPAQIRESCELFLVETRIGSLEIIAEVQDEIQTRMDFKEDAGLEALHNFLGIADAVSKEDKEKILNIIPDYGARIRALKSIENLCPEPEAGYVINISNSTGPVAVFTPQIREYIRDTFWVKDADQQESTAAISGTLVMIRIQGCDSIAIVSGNREIPCYFPTELQDVVSQLVAGSLVEVTGKVRLDTVGAVEKVVCVESIDTLSLMPFHIKEFRWGQRRFVLKRAVNCQPYFRNDLWVYECELLGLHSYAYLRKQALEDFHEEFVAIWDGVALEKDENLAPDALRLKNIIIDLVEKAE